MTDSALSSPLPSPLPAGGSAGMPDVGSEVLPTGPSADDVRHALLARIDAGDLRPGERLGSERDLAASLAVSRSTLRQALRVLEDESVVRRVPGRGGGTFVSQSKIERDLSRIVGLPAMLRSQGVTAGTRVVKAGLGGADDAVARELGLETGALVVSLVRIRLADGSPISVEHATLPADRFPGLLELPLGGSVYELLEEHYGTRPGEAVERIEVVPASPDEAAILGIAPGAPLLSITRTTVDEDGKPIEHSHDLFRAERTRIVVRTPGRGGITRAARTPGRVVELRAQGVPRASAGGGAEQDQQHKQAKEDKQGKVDKEGNEGKRDGDDRAGAKGDETAEASDQEMLR
ncbi:MAG TPA: GntR family transcriptional regulator [Acidimicrobiales bacterium]|nr:GntR family transcriptional regulator [Acidimicrobiales bacterium]